MRDSILEKLDLLWAQYPDQRLCQLIYNLTHEIDSFYVTDDILEQQLTLALTGGHPFFP